MQSLLGQFEVDGMAAEDGHNSLADLYFHPSCSLFEQEVSPKLMWVFPPDDMLDLVVTYLCNLIRARAPLRIALLVPERPNSAPWFWRLKAFKRVCSFRAGSQLFAERDAVGQWVKLPPVREPCVVLQSGVR